ncbi:uncharacterized protein H6S33_005982 [Morchella sextelata]|uniref:uncharacterized protein n=1 Tax=Morchella sextelata TaxID=1174677 RepID=UPI001D039DF3|nr:uncharacterized protein H6S33_005982 [Morchella sextelata]KAH0614096.1 hypothetical protein H6S33_005982 [Morchella sextelata]
MPDLFAVPVFFVIFRETIEAGIIISVLLAFLKQSFNGPEHDPKIYKRLVWQVWLGSLAGLLICMIIGGGFLGAFYTLGKDIWGTSEDLWEGVFCLIASIIITIMGAAILRLSKLQAKWSTKLTATLASKPKNMGGFTKKYAMALLPFITVLREGLEAVVFVGGVSISSPASAFPLPVITGLIAGGIIGWIIYKGGNTVKVQMFLVASTAVLYLVAAGLFSRAVWDFEMWQYGRLVGGDVAETGTGPGSYDIRKSVWHVNCCSPTFNQGGGWGIFNAILGWQNSATYGSVLAYNIYWIVVSAGFVVMWFKEKKGRYPFCKQPENAGSTGDSAEIVEVRTDEKGGNSPMQV